MDLAQLRNMGVVSSNPLLKRDIQIRFRPLLPKEQWTDPLIEERQAEYVEEVHTVWIRRKSAADEILLNGVKDRVDRIYMLIHRCAFQENGERIFPTFDDAIGLDLTMFASLVQELNALHGEGDVGKKSQPRMKRGASSRSPSADEPSLSGVNTSPPPSGTSGSSTAASLVP